MADPAVHYLRFLGFPTAGIPMADSPPVDPDRFYSGVHPDTAGWPPGESRALLSAEKITRRKGRVVVFDATATRERLLQDYGPTAPAWEGLDGYGFRDITAAAHKRSRA